MFQKLIFLLFFCLVANAFFAQSKLEKRLENLERQRFEAMEKRDTFFLHQVVAENATIGHSNGFMENRNSHLQNIASTKIIYEKMQPLEMNIRTFRKSAVINGLIRVKGEYKGTPFDIKLRYTDVYQKQKRKWKLVAWQSVKVE